MRRYLLNGGVLGALFGVVGNIQATRKGPRDFRLILMWAGWAVSFALAIATVMEQERDLEIDEAGK